MFYSIQRIILLVRSLLLTIENQPTNNYTYYCSNHDSQTSELQYFIKQNFMPIAKYRIHEIEDATRQLGDKLSDNKLRLDFLSYIEAFLNQRNSNGGW